MRPVFIIGSGGHARSLINIIELNSIAIGGIYDESFRVKNRESINGYSLKGKLSAIAPTQKLVLAIGDNKKREVLYERYRKQLLEAAVIHPSACIEKRVVLGACNSVFAKAYINSNVMIGDDNVINTGAIIEHESIIGNHNHISIGAIVCGRATVGNNCFIGAGAVVIDRIHLCDNVVVGAQAVVVKDIKHRGIYAGNPARKIG